LRLGKPLSAEGLMLVLAHFVFLGLTFKARRFVEYWPMFCLLSAAFLSAPLISRLAEWCEDRATDARKSRASWVRPAGAVTIVLVLFAIVCLSPVWHAVRRAARCQYDLPEIRKAMNFLQEQSQAGDVVFTDDWDIFPVFFYHNSHNHYVVGLDPKFTHARRPILWERYVKLSRGQIPARISVATRDESGSHVSERVNIELQDIPREFGAKFVVTDRDHRRLAAKLADRTDVAKLVYPAEHYEDCRDAPYLVFRVEGHPDGLVPGSHTNP
jgi:hypothetical protein